VQPDVTIRDASPHEGERLREIAEAAKGHWGYDREVVRRWAADGDFSAEGLRSKTVFVAQAHGKTIAWAALVPKGEVVWLDDMWVEPEWIGKGVGGLLFGHALERARELGGTTLEWEAEPNAVGFYEKVGGRYLRDSDPTEWGRVLPVMAIDLG
jgi:GNAT superfamily N-acetyltransferase